MFWNDKCIHEWEVLSETTTKSKFEVAMETMKNLGVTKAVDLPWQLCDGTRKHIQVLTCKKCGKLERFCEDI